ncbi:hypothetical protein [Anseongella ginsenosidimutans]|nr:hypothetical protein [Anseongella ginsenosidimutans]
MFRPGRVMSGIGHFQKAMGIEKSYKAPCRYGSVIVHFEGYVKKLFQNRLAESVETSGDCLDQYRWFDRWYSGLPADPAIRRFELSYDRFHVNAGDTYRVVNDRYQEGKLIQHGTIPYSAIGKALNDDYEEVVENTQVRPAKEKIIQYDGRKLVEGQALYADHSFTPLAWYFMNGWLQDFAYRIGISWWMFAAAGLLAIAIALLTVGFQSIKAALMNPVKSLRSE